MEIRKDILNLVEEFIQTQVIKRGLDERTTKAYRLDLQLFHTWSSAAGSEESLEDQMDAYLEHLAKERGLRTSTICRKQQVFRYYLSYLQARGLVKGEKKLKPIERVERDSQDTQLTKKEVDAFFHAIDQEYSELESDFRKRVCLRDQIMMELLFYHGIEISELLRLEILDYNQKTAVLKIRRKKQKDRSVYLFSRNLQEQMVWWLSEHEYFEHEEAYCNRMFLSKLGKPISMKMVINIFEKYRVLAGIQTECTPKDLKNSLGRYAEEVVWEMG